MSKRRFVFVLVGWGLCVLGLPAATRTMPVEEVRPGMVGVGRTVFQGDTLEEFKVEILGILRNTMGPKRDLILARLSGGPLAKTGVIAGMSGSPVYIDGRLVGAVSYSLGQFSTEPIAGITPFAEMVEAASTNAPRPASARLRLDGPLTPDRVIGALRSALGAVRPFADRSSDVSAIGELALGTESRVATLLRPIATPLVFGGFDRDTIAPLLSAFEEGGFVPVNGGDLAAAGRRVQAPGAPALRPGDPVGVALVDGDLLMGATGTVTDVDGDQVYAFGHAFYNLGPTRFPMTRAYVHVVLPSLLSSVKLASTGEVVGTFRQDRPTAIAGTLGPPPRRVPVHVSLMSEGGVSRDFHFSVTDDQLLTPLLIYASLANTLASYERQFGAATFTVQGRAVMRQAGSVDFGNIFTGDSPAIAAAASVAMPLAALAANDMEPVEIESVDLAIRTSEQPRVATIERAWIDAVEPRAGRTVPLKILLRSYRGEETLQTIPVEIPANAHGPLMIMVSDGTRLAQWEQREARQALDPATLAQMIRQMNRTRRNNRVYVRLFSQDPGAVVSGEFLSSLPASALAVYEGQGGGGNMAPLRSSTLGEWDVPVDQAVVGMRMLTVDLRPGE